MLALAYITFFTFKGYLQLKKYRVFLGIAKKK